MGSNLLVHTGIRVDFPFGEVLGGAGGGWGGARLQREAPHVASLVAASQTI